MNRNFLNGEPLNGSSLAAAVVLATAAIAGSSSVVAAPTRSTDALSPVFSGAQVVADADVIFGGFAQPSGVANIQAIPTHEQSAFASISGSSNVTAFVFRGIPGQAEVIGSAQMLVIPAAEIGGADIGAGVSLSAEATRIQPGRTLLDTLASVTITTEPTVTRFVSANASGSASVRVESGVNGVYDAYGDLAGRASVSIANTGIVFRITAANLSSSSTAQGMGTRVQFAQSQIPSLAAVVVGDPAIFSGGVAHIGGAASATASALRVPMGWANIVAASPSVSAFANMRHAASATTSGSANLVARAVRTTFSGALPSASASVLATALRVVPSDAAIQTSAAAVSAAFVTRAASVTFDGACNISAKAKLAEQGAAHLAASCSAFADALRTAMAQSAIEAQGFSVEADAHRVLSGGVSVAGGVFIGAEAVRVALAQSSILSSVQISADCEVIKFATALIYGTCDVVADTIANPDSFDPPERTFIRQAYQSDFVRPAPLTEFRRAA